MPIEVRGRTLLDPKTVSMIINMDSKNVTAKEIQDLFSTKMDMKTRKKKEPVIPRNTYIKLKAGQYINKKDIETTPGLLLFNKLFVEGTFESIVPDSYYNEVLDKKGISKFLNIIADGVSNGKIDGFNHVLPFMKRFEFYGYMMMGGLCKSYTPGTANTDKEIRAARDKMLNELPENPTLAQMVEVEDKLVDMAKKKLENDPGMTLFKSGARGSFENNYKMDNVIIGPILNPNSGEYDFVTSNFNDGIQKKDIPAIGNSVVNGSYPKAVGTADAGHKTKQFYMGFQSLKVGPSGSNCGTKKTIKVLITSNNKDNYVDSYIMENDKLVLLTKDNINSYVGKVVNKRTPQYCISDDICEVCAGKRYRNVGITEIGASSVALPNGLMNKNMKLFHDTKVKFHTVDIDALIQ